MIFRFKILHFGLSFLILIFAFSIIASHEANAGTIIRAPSYLGLNNGLVGYWTFDGPDISGTRAKDRSGNNNHGTLTNGPTATQGKIGQALDFDGSTNYVEVGDPASIQTLTEGTISAWFKVSQLDATQAIVSYSNTSTENFVIQAHSDNGIFFIFKNDNVNIVNGNTSPDFTVSKDTWTHVALTVDGTGNSIYVNGRRAVVTYFAGDASTSVFFANLDLESFEIGRRHISGFNNYFFGNIDDVRIYNRALTASDLERIYKIGLGSKFNNASGGDSLDKGLVGHWTFDGSDISGTRAKDRSGNNNHGTITGATRVAGKLGQALSFDGNDDVIIDTIPAGSGALTASAWIKFSTTGSFRTILSIHDSDINSIFDCLITDVNKLACDNQVPSGNYAISSDSIGTNKWVHVTAVRNSNGTSVTLYVDGLQNGPANQTVDPAPGTPDYMYIGSRDAEYFNGQIDDVRIYNRALTADEVKKLYNQTQSKFNSSVSASSIDRGLVGHWTFDGSDISGTRAKDRSGNNNHGTITGATRVAGKIGQGLSFDGSDDHISVGDAAPLKLTGPVTVSVWVKGGAQGDNTGIAGKYNGQTNQRGYMIEGSPGVVGGRKVGWTYQRDAGVNNSGDRIITPDNVLNDTWRHVVGVFSPSSFARIYVDGMLAVEDVTSVQSAIADNTSEFEIARANESDIDIFDGRIDDVRIYNRALTADEVKKLYNMGK